MNRKILFFVFIFTMSISSGPVMGESRFSIGGIKSVYGDFTRNLAPLSKLVPQDPLAGLNDQVDAALARGHYRSHFGSQPYRFYHRSPGHVRHFNSPGHYFGYGYHRPFYKYMPYGYSYRYRPYRHYDKHNYFRYYLPPGPYYQYRHYGWNDDGHNLGLPWVWR